jgi:AcrR family transcriptional regulator
MPRPARYTTDELLDAAAALLDQDGPAAVTMLAVARAVGAPSGSIYHRFPTRAALCGQLWMRTEERFLTGFIATVGTPRDAQQRCVAGAVFTVQWCRAHPSEAKVLLVGADALGADEWPEEVRAHQRCLRRRLRAVLTGIHADADRVSAAVIDIPYAVVRRHLVAGRAVPAGVDAIVSDCAKALIPPS